MYKRQAVLSGIADGKYDFAISAIAYSPSRAESLRLSDVYYSTNTGYGFIVRTEDVGKYTDLDSLKDAVVITQSGSVQEALYNEYVNGDCKEFKLVANMTAVSYTHLKARNTAPCKARYSPFP